MINRQRALVLSGAVIASAIGVTGFAGASSAMAATNVSRSAAVQTALARTGGGNVQESYKETEHRRPVWCVNIWKGNRLYDVDVSRHSGKVVEVESEIED